MKTTQYGFQNGAPEMNSLLRAQVALYEQLQKLAGKQRALIAGDDTQPLLRLLAQRQRLTTKLTRLNERLAPFRESWRGLRETLNDEERRAMEELIAEAADQLQKLLAGDEQDARMLKLRQRRVGEELESVHSCRQAVAAYKAGGPAKTACFDQMHEQS